MLCGIALMIYIHVHVCVILRKHILLSTWFILVKVCGMFKKIETDLLLVLILH